MLKVLPVVLLLLFQCAYAQDEGANTVLSLNDDQLPPAFKVNYEITKGNMVLGNTESVWQPTTVRHWVYRWVTHPQGIAKLFVDKVTQQSTFEKSNTGMRVARYLHEQKGRNQLIQFDWKNLIANSEYKDRRKSLPLTENTFDELGFHILIMSNIDHLPDQFTVPVVRKNRTSTYEFQTTVSNPLETKAGKFDALVLERKKDNEEQTTHRIWVARSYFGIPIRYEKIENGKREYMAEITDFEWLNSPADHVLSQTSSATSNHHSVE